MPTGWYTIQEETDGYKKQVKYSRQSIQWLEYIMRTENVQIKHAENGGEYRIDNFQVDGYDEENRTVYEFHGCFWHGHSCHTGYDEEKWNQTLKRDEAIRNAGYNLVTITSCKWIKMPESKDWYHTTQVGSESEEVVITKDSILNDVVKDNIFVLSKLISIHRNISLKSFPSFLQYLRIPKLNWTILVNI